MVDMSTDPSHPPISLLVCEYLESDQKSLLISDLTPESNDYMRTFATVSTLQYGLRDYNVDDLKEKMLNHIIAISKWERIIEDSETLSWKLLRAICRFQEADPTAQRVCIYSFQKFSTQKLNLSQKNLLCKAIMVNRIQYVKGIRIAFSEDSASKAVENLINPPANLPSGPFLSARTLNRQIKGILNLLLEDLQKDFLDEFDWELRRKENDTWALCLCSYLAFAMCVERLQIAVDGFVQFQISKGDRDPKLIQQYGTEICRRLEKCTLEHAWLLLTGKLRSLLKTNNPFKYGVPKEKNSSKNESEMNLVNDLRQIMIDHGN
jgi:hypothetical protein